MDYKPLKDAMVSYFREVYYSLGNISQKVMDALNPSSGLENRLAFAGVPNDFVQENMPVGEYGGLYLFSKREKHNKAFNDGAGAYAGTKKRPHGDFSNNESIRWDDPNLDDNQKAKLILEAAGLKKSDLRYKRTPQPKKEDISWARYQSGTK